MPGLGRIRRAHGAWRYGRRAGLRLLAEFAKAYPDAFFIEIGANDGEHEDLLQRFIRSGSWKGVMVEPVPYVYEQLRANYASRPGIELENCAIADRDGSMPFFHLPRSADHVSDGLPGWYQGLGSFSREVLLGHAGAIPDIESRIVTTEVPTLTFESLCRKHCVERLDLLLTDTEGYDWEILRAIDFSTRRPRMVVYEHYHLPAADQAECRERMASFGYESMEEHFDTFCLLTDVDDALTRRWRRLSPRLPALRAEEDHSQ